MVTIERYRKGTERLLWDVFYSSIRHVCIKDYSQEQVMAWARDDLDPNLWSKRIAGINPFVAIVDNEIAGYADIQENGYIDHFFVHSRFQSIGVGSALMDNLLAHGMNQKKIYSNVSITAKPFFEKYGFKVIKEQCVVINGCKITNFVMELVKR